MGGVVLMTGSGAAGAAEDDGAADADGSDDAGGVDVDCGGGGGAGGVGPVGVDADAGVIVLVSVMMVVNASVASLTVVIGCVDCVNVSCDGAASDGVVFVTFGIFLALGGSGGRDSILRRTSCSVIWV